MAQSQDAENPQMANRAEDQERAERLSLARSILDDFNSKPASASGSANSAYPPKGQALEYERGGSAYEEKRKSEQKLYRQAREAAVRFIGLDKGKSSGKVRDRLLQNGYEADLADQVVQDLTDLGYISRLH